MNEIVFKGILVLALFTLSMGVAAYSTWAERKVAALLQDRIGPNRAGFWGLLQPLADGGKVSKKILFRKGRIGFYSF